MFDDLRDHSNQEAMPQVGIPAKPEPVGPEPRIMGMTSGQRLIISIMLLATVFVVGLMCLLVTGRVWLF